MNVENKDVTNNEIQNINYTLKEKENTNQSLVEYTELMKELEQHEAIMNQVDFNYDIHDILSDDDDIYDRRKNYSSETHVDVIDNEEQLDYDTRYASYFQHYNDSYKKDDLKEILFDLDLKPLSCNCLISFFIILSDCHYMLYFLKI